MPGLWGCVAVFGVHWRKWEWPPEWYKIGIMAKELCQFLIALCGSIVIQDTTLTSVLATLI